MVNVAPFLVILLELIRKTEIDKLVGRLRNLLVHHGCEC